MSKTNVSATRTAWQPISTLPHDYDLPFLYRDDDDMVVAERTGNGRFVTCLGSDKQGDDLEFVFEGEPGAEWAPILTRNKGKASAGQPIETTRRTTKVPSADAVSHMATNDLWRYLAEIAATLETIQRDAKDARRRRAGRAATLKSIKYAARGALVDVDAAGECLDELLDPERAAAAIARACATAT